MIECAPVVFSCPSCVQLAMNGFQCVGVKKNPEVPINSTGFVLTATFWFFFFFFGISPMKKS